jgi:diacylglycerol kinase family enzyme
VVGDQGQTTVAALINARAGRVRRHPELIDEIAAELSPQHVEVLNAVADVQPAVETLRDEGVATVVIVGGDGTVTGTLTPLIDAWSAAGRELPQIALLPGGSVNTIPTALGGRGSPRRLLRALLRRAARPRVRLLNVLSIHPGGGGRRYGMIFGNGATTRWLDHYYSGSARGRLGAALGVVTALGSISVRGRLARRLFEPFEAKVDIDGEAVEDERFTAMAAGAIPQIGLGFKPFYGAGRHPGHIHWIMTGVGPQRMGLEVAQVALGLHPPFSRLVHASAARVTVRCADPLPYTVDGDLFPGARDIEISAGPELAFVSG